MLSGFMPRFIYQTIKRFQAKLFSVMSAMDSARWRMRWRRHQVAKSSLSRGYAMHVRVGCSLPADG